MSAPSHTTQEVTLGLLDQLGQAATSMMGGTGNQSPSILYMALTARAANHAVEEMRKRNL